MNIYVKMELRNRELEGRLLLALAAAERGHQVLLGVMNTLLSHRTFLAPGIYHDKSLTPRREKVRLHRMLVDQGFVITSQDEEHGLDAPSYDAFALRRFSDTTLATAAAAFTWGPHDTKSLCRLYPDRVDRIRMTGSPRVDLWRPELAGLHAEAPLAGIDPSRPYVLVAPGSVPLLPNPFWVALTDFRARHFRDDDDAREWAHYEEHAVGFRLVGRLVRALRLLARTHPTLQIVVRPHPKSPDGAWEALLGPMPNVLVTRSGSSGQWIERAVALVHNGSTTGAEAQAGRVPVISFQPDGEYADDFTNRLGRVAHDELELVDLVAAASDPTVRREWVTAVEAGTSRPDPVLAERLAALEGPLAVDRIVDVWEEHATADLGQRNRPRRALLLASGHRAAGSWRRSAHRGSESAPKGLDMTPKFPPLQRVDVMRLVAGLQRTLGRFADVEVDLIGPRLVRLRPRVRPGRP